MAHPFTFGHGLLRLVEVVGGGIAYGLVVAVVIGRPRRRNHDPAIQTLVSLITPFVGSHNPPVVGSSPTYLTSPAYGRREESLAVQMPYPIISFDDEGNT
jgi:hypothetical protein